MLSLLGCTGGAFRGCYGNTGVQHFVCLHRQAACQAHLPHCEGGREGGRERRGEGGRRGEMVIGTNGGTIFSYTNFSLTLATALANSLALTCLSSAFWKEMTVGSWSASSEGTAIHGLHLSYNMEKADLLFFQLVLSLPYPSLLSISGILATARQSVRYLERRTQTISGLVNTHNKIFYQVFGCYVRDFIFLLVRRWRLVCL